MPSDYNKIRADNIVEYGRGTRHLSFLGRLYTDRTHFIFELLQNAEDAGASRILFSLFNDRLEVTHDGRPFDDRDVRGVCGVGEGTKTDDLTKIGKFGIGFKSVYAYTSKPEVYSGDESFRIENYVRPYAMEHRKAGNLWTTLFVFAFDAAGIDPEAANLEIGERLSSLSARTLIFLRKIKEIEYRLPDMTRGVYMREEVVRGPARQVTIIGENDGGDEEGNWLIFERPVTVPDGRCQVRVEIGFRLARPGKDNAENIIGIRDAPLVVYFPTEKLTRFGFLIQGPYRTTPSRDNIPKDDTWNKALVQETAHLLTDALPLIKDLGLLSVPLLEALPVRMVDFSKDGMFYPIVEAVRTALANEDLLPAEDGTFVSGQNAKLARGADLRKLLSEDCLCQLYYAKNSIKWLIGEITQDRTPDLRTYLLNELHVEEITPDNFARKIGRSFLENQSDEWIIDFYQYLSGQNALWKAPRHSWDSTGPLRSKEIIRLSDNSHIAPFKPDGQPAAFLPCSSNTGYKLVKSNIASDKDSLRFLEQLGLTTPDTVDEVINRILPRYASSPVEIPLSYQKDLSMIKDALETDSSKKREYLYELLKKSFWVKAESAKNGEKVLKRPEEVYIKNMDLEMYFAGNASAWFLDKELAGFSSSLKDLGVGSSVRITCKQPNHQGHVIISGSRGWHKRGLKGFDPDAEADGLEHALSNPDVEKSRFVWNSVLVPCKHLLAGTVEESSRQDYANSSKEEDLSWIGHFAVKSSWLPGKDLTLHYPREIALEELPDGFEKDEQLARLLYMKLPVTKDQIQLLAEAIGIPVDGIDYLRKNKESLPEFIKWNESQKKPKRPVATSHDQDRRNHKIEQDLRDAPLVEREKRLRTIRTSKPQLRPEIREYLKDMNTNENGELICQLCHDIMPFKLKDGYYFEAVEVVWGLTKESIFNHLALCPNCAAKFEHANPYEPEEIRALILNAENQEVQLVLAEETHTIIFTEMHISDIKQALKEIQCMEEA